MTSIQKLTKRSRLVMLACLLAFATASLPATENVPHAPFARWADLPQAGQLLAGLTYQESEAYHIWAGREFQNIDYRKGGEHYGIDVNQGYFPLQYGLTEKWAADLTFGVTTAGWRYFSNPTADGTAQSATGLMDTSLGLRYQALHEDETGHSWTPTLTLRAGAVLPGSFKQDFPFAPGLRSAAIEPEILLRKHFGWPGFGLYADGLFRWNRTTDNDQYLVAAGLFQRIQRWELDAGYRHLGTVSGESIGFDPVTRMINYPIGVRENNDSIEAGFSYTTSKHQIRLGFYSRTVIGGVNTDKKFWVGGFLDIPVQLRHLK